MSLASPEEFIIGTCLVRVYAAPIALPGVEGWVGAWAIYRLSDYPGSEPLRIGDTDVEGTEATALGIAKTISSAVAMSL